MEASEITKLIIANGLAIGFVLIREIWSMFKDDTKENTKAIKELTTTATNLSKDITKLQLQMEYVHRDLSLIPELKRDVDAAHIQLRKLTSQVRDLQHHRGEGKDG